MSATPKKMAQPRKSQPSTLMLGLLPVSSLTSSTARLCQPPGHQRPTARDASVAGPDRLALRRVAAGAYMGVVQVERRALGPDPRDRGEVVPRRRARRRPFERIGEPPR